MRSEKAPSLLWIICIHPPGKAEMSAVCLKGRRTDGEMIQVWHGFILVVGRVHEWRLMSTAYLRCCAQALHAA